MILKANFKGGYSHGLGDGAEIEHALLLDAGEIEQAVIGPFQRRQDHFRAGGKCLVLILRLEEVLKVLDVLGPDFFGPESSLVVKIFLDVTDDVDLLQELAHGLVQVGPLEEGGIRLALFDEQARAAFADKACNVVTVLLVVLDRVDAVVVDAKLAFLDIVGHPVAHALGDVLDDGLVGRLELLELLNDDIELDTELSVLLVWTVLGEGPSVLLDDVVEVAKDGLLLRQWYRHVIFDGVKAAQDQIEDGDGDEDVRVQLQNDGHEAAAGHGQKMEASLQRLALLGLITLVHGVVPDLPAPD